jgi:hypothetical protein
MLLFINSEPLADVANLNTNVAIISKTINQGFKIIFTVLKRLNKPLPLANIKTLLGIALIWL